MIENIVIAILSYLIGSIPTAYLVLKLKYKIDITKTGSGNVGALNSYEVSKSKTVGIFVLIFDLLKGLIPVMVLKYFINASFFSIGLSLFFLLLGHCFSVWLKFKGGRGLATAFGGTIIFMPLVAILWCLIWLFTFLKFRNVHIGNAAATVGAILISLIFVRNVATFSFPQPSNLYEIAFVIIFCLGLIMIKHIEPINDLIRKRTNEK